MRRIRFVFPVVGALLVAGILTAQTADAGGGPRDHDGGFFLRLSAGGGMATTGLDEANGTSRMDGSTGDINLAIGGVITPNLAIHGTLFGWLVSDPKAEFPGTGSGTLENVDLSLSAIGAGITYYLMPANIYFSGSIGAGELTIDVKGLSISTDTGLAADLTIGKEWWVGDNWGLGVAGGFGFHMISDGGSPEDWKGTSFGIRFSATRN